MLSSILNRSKGASGSSSSSSNSSSNDPLPAATTDIATTIQDEAKTAFLNQSLDTLHEVFPGGDVEEMRRLLSTTSEESRLYVVTEILLKSSSSRSSSSAPRPGVALAPWEKFRTDEYQAAVKKALHKEFRGLSKSTIQAVLAEHNFQYSRSRATLSEIAAKSWRFSFSQLFRRAARDSEYSGPTGCKELDDELFELARPAREAQIADDRAIAVLLNEAEAAAASSLLECECCFGDYAWEDMVACTGGHFFCHNCLRRSVEESIFGQGKKNLLPEKASVCCLSSTASPPCQEFVHPDVLRAVLPEEMLHSLEDRTAQEAIEKSGLNLVRCPFCGYAEVDELQSYRIRRPELALAGLFVGSIFLLLPYGKQILLLLPLLLLSSLPGSAAALPQVQKALHNMALRRRGTLFRCENPRCKRHSCITCGKEWLPFHKCYEKEEDAARIFVEKAMADAVKRTCPLCHVSFVKSDGCNKLTCPCGYVMCYICRADIRSVGYKHFCQHFRQVPGTACTDCDACDLYANEDEAAAIRNAAKAAEQEYWRRYGRPGGAEREKGGANGQRRWWEVALEWWLEWTVERVD